MNNVIKLLETKNYWFSKFLKTCDQFLVDLRVNPEKSIADLDLFEKNRLSLLNILKKTEDKIQVLLAEDRLRHYVPTSEEKTKINFYLREKDSVLKQIITLDTEIIKLMEELQSKNLENLKNLEKGKNALAKYKSQGNASERLDKQL